MGFRQRHGRGVYAHSIGGGMRLTIGRDDVSASRRIVGRTVVSTCPVDRGARLDVILAERLARNLALADHVARWLPLDARHALPSGPIAATRVKFNVCHDVKDQTEELDGARDACRRVTARFDGGGAVLIRGDGDA